MELLGPKPVLVGIDHAFSFPMHYFEEHHLSLDWHAFLDDFQKHWPTDEDKTSVKFVREDAERTGERMAPAIFRSTGRAGGRQG